MSFPYPNQNPNFETLLRHAELTKPPFSGPWAVPPASILSLAALASMWLYVIPSWKAGRAQGSDILAALQVGGNTFSAGAVVFNVGGHYIGLIKAARDVANYLTNTGLLNSKLANKINTALDTAPTAPLNRAAGNKILTWLRKTQLHVLLLAAFTAVPLATAAAFYRDWDNEPDALLILKTVLTGLSYTLIHTLPISLILNVPWLNFLLVKIPAAPFFLLRHVYHHCCLSREKLASIQNAKEAIHKQTILRVLPN